MILEGPYFHGGARGLTKGRLLLPPSVTRAPSNADYGAAGVCRRDRVYVHTEIDHAYLYALLAPPRGQGAVYEVEPIGELEVDPDYDTAGGGASYAVPEARIVRVVEKRLRTYQGMSPRQAARLLSPDGDRCTAGARLLAHGYD